MLGVPSSFPIVGARHAVPRAQHVVPLRGTVGRWQLTSDQSFTSLIFPDAYSDYCANVIMYTVFLTQGGL